MWLIWWIDSRLRVPACEHVSDLNKCGDAEDPWGLWSDKRDHICLLSTGGEKAKKGHAPPWRIPIFHLAFSWPEFSNKATPKWKGGRNIVSQYNSLCMSWFFSIWYVIFIVMLKLGPLFYQRVLSFICIYLVNLNLMLCTIV